MLTRKQKEQLVGDLSAELKNSKTSVICGYQGMTVSDVAQLRSQLREKEAKMQVLKKTLIQIALKNADIEFDPKAMEGQVAIVFGGDDEIFSPKILHDFAKKNESLKILAGVLEGKMISASEVEGLAKLPSKEELLAKVVGTINAPISGFVNVLAGNLRNFVYAINAIKESKESQAS
jgi:large subunit ribosomal protein L10